jgi:beta-galactosidase
MHRTIGALNKSPNLHPGDQSRQTGSEISRRLFVREFTVGASALAGMPILGCHSVPDKSKAVVNGPASRSWRLEDGWLFGGELQPGGLAEQFDDSAFQKVTLPHCVTKLSWRNWSWEDWQKIFCYRRHFILPKACEGQRVFIDFDGVMVGAEPAVNGISLPKHLGGYLPFHYEVTNLVRSGSNLLAVAIDSRWSNVPPQGSPKGPQRVDYLEPGGIHRPVRLRYVPRVFISDVFAKPVHVLDPSRRLEVICTIDAAVATAKPMQVAVELRKGEQVVAKSQEELRLEAPGQKELTLTLANLGDIALWDVDSPQLYSVVATLLADGRPVHDYRARTGFREARFDLDGFFLNGRRVQIFGLNRHELYPYVGYAMPPRVKRRDAEILKRDFNCNFVRCSHYPQSPAFLDACDELGLLVWQEVPGWGYIGDDAWKDLLVRDARGMIVRDRSRPSVVIWGTRANESANDVELYRRTKEVAKELDDTRPTSGSMTGGSRQTWVPDWHEDVFAFDDYHAAPDHTVGIENPVGRVPYMLAEAVGQFNYAVGKKFDSYYRRAGDPAMQPLQALRHAQAHSKAAANPRICGVVAWCGFEYGSLVNAYERVKYPGVADIFRIPKLGASFYLSQCDPRSRVVIEPDFYWDFGPKTPRGPGDHAAIFSNCDRLEVFINGKRHAKLEPDLKNYLHLRQPPFFADLDMEGAGNPELRIDGYVEGRLLLSRSFSSDHRRDKFWMKADDQELDGDGVDATRLVFKVVDKFGANRAFAGGGVSFEVTGPGEIVGDNPFGLEASGGAGAVWIKTRPKSSGRITVSARHSTLGKRSVSIFARRTSNEETFAR